MPPPAENLTVLRHARRQTVSGQSVSHGFELEGSATRPVIRGRHLVVACGHYLAALAGMRMRDRGGNAIDAGVAMAFAQAVLEFQSYGFGGECPILIYAAATREAVAINGNTRAPAAATIEWVRDHGITLIPGDGFLPAGVPAVPDALITALDRYGRLALKDVLAPAIELAAHGFPVYEGMRDRIAALRAARDRFYKGDIAREIVAFQRDTKVRDANGMESSGLLTAEDFAAFETRVEAPVTLNYRGYDVYKCGPWSQGPVFLQQLALLEGYDLAALRHNSPDHIHLVIEATKLAFADRERYYGDPQYADVPLRGLLSRAYAAERYVGILRVAV